MDFCNSGWKAPARFSVAGLNAITYSKNTWFQRLDLAQVTSVVQVKH